MSSSKKQANNSLKSLQSKAMVAFGTFVIALLGVTTRGSWFIILIHFMKQFMPNSDDSTDTTLDTHTNETKPLDLSSLFDFSHLHHLHWYCLASVGVTFLSYWGLGGWFQWYFYFNRKDKPEEWKCQPDRWLTPENERHEFLLGSWNMLVGGTVSGIIACHVMNGGYNTLYFDASEKGWLYLIFSTLVLFVLQDGAAYYLHMTLHNPWLYRNVHKMHHRYHSPTAFSAVAMHPCEFIMFQLVLGSPMFFLPLYSGSFILLLVYSYYYGMVDHSGVKMDAVWPWQPKTMFHDDHHRYFHVNFGFNCLLWDWMHDTLRIETRTYGEDIFGGRGKDEVKAKDQ